MKNFDCIRIGGYTWESLFREKEAHSIPLPIKFDCVGGIEL